MVDNDMRMKWREVQLQFRGRRAEGDGRWQKMQRKQRRLAEQGICRAQELHNRNDPDAARAWQEECARGPKRTGRGWWGL